MALSFYEQAQRLYPFMPDWVLRAYADGLGKNAGDAEMAWQEVRQNPNHAATFKGIRRTEGPMAGSLRMTELEYMAGKDAFRQTLQENNLNPAMFEGAYSRLVEGDKSIDEFKANLSTLTNGILNNTPEVRAFFEANYKVSYNPEMASAAPHVALAMAMDPKIGQDLLARRVTVAQIGGTASQYGFDRSLRRSEALASRGVTQATANEMYQTAGQRLRHLDTFAERFNDEDRDFGIGEFEEAYLGDVGQTERAQRLTQAELASFSGQRRVRQDQDGGLGGLRQR